LPPNAVQVPKRYAAFDPETFIAAQTLVANKRVSLIGSSLDGQTVFGDIQVNTKTRRRAMLRSRGAPEQLSGECSCGKPCCVHLCALALCLDAGPDGLQDVGASAQGAEQLRLVFLLQPDAGQSELLRLFCWYEWQGSDRDVSAEIRLDLLPLLRDNLAARHPQLEMQHLCQQPPEQPVTITGQGRQLAVPAVLLKGLLESLPELQSLTQDARAGIPLSLARALSLRLALDEPESQGHGLILVWQEPESLVRLRDALQQGAQGRAELPAGLECEVRPDQLQGLAWLQCLARHGLGGILADDKDLGQSQRLQCLALALWSRHQSQHPTPTLIIASESRLGFWCAEALRSVPSLRLLVLDGSGPQQALGELSGYDLIVASYSLVIRDQEALAQQGFQLLVLDDAQWIKNPASQTAQAVRCIKARTRLCLSTAPPENHLGELWAQFDLLMPGFFGGPNFFQRLVRDPIEKWGDIDASQRLGRRIAPFMLRAASYGAPVPLSGRSLA
jgi:hypothetical protein